MKSRIIWKLLLINMVVIGFVMVIVWFSIDTLAAGYFMTLMERYHISPEPAHAMFVDAVHRYLLWACLAAAALAAVLSFLMMRRVLSPLTRMTDIARRIAGGDFEGRVPETSADEVGQLAGAFNRMAESLAKLEGLRRSLMIDVAHELRTPLTNMRGYLEALKDGVLPPTPETVVMLHDETLRLADLVEDVLRLARADAAKETLKRRKVNISELVNRTQNAFVARLSEKRIEVRQRFTENLPPVSADPDRIDRVLRSLMDNAVRYSPEGGVLTIAISSNPSGVRATFSNTGNVRPEDLPFLFERFFRGERSRSRDHGGAGIGLSIVKELVEAHGGSVGADLDGDTVSIWFELPLDNG
ncbi:MAG: HAMP domain-containing protein [Desulfobacterales bacterium]